MHLHSRFTWFFCLGLNVLTLNVNSVQHSKYLGCWCSGSLCRQDISNHDIDFVEWARSCLTWGMLSTACVMSIWRNDIKCKYMLLFPLKNLAHKGSCFINWLDQYMHIWMLFIIISYLYPYISLWRLFWWLSARLQYLQCISNGDTAVLH